ncbi:MAG: C4-dicarboxylate ABC transporter [Acidobacteria bacterium]|nr:C4-dicarboxylate ABC transporter [Acidobacteriota bacterium]
MTPAVLSLIALLVAIVLSCTSRINVGLLAIAFAWLIGTGPAGWRADQVMAGFPASLFITLTGVTLLFGLAEVNGTLERLARRVIRWSGGHPRVVPIVFFLAAGLLSSVGPGAISAVALLIPLAMAIGVQAGVPRVLTALMVANGANAGNLSPISAVGIIANSRMAEAGLGQHEFRVWFANFAAHLLVATAAWFLFRRADEPPAPADTAAARTGAADSDVLSPAQRLTALIITAWIIGVVGFELNVGLAAFAAASILIVIGHGDEATAIKRIPWSVILMVCGVTVLIGVLEKTGGLDLFTSLLAAIATPVTINGTIAFVSGLISSWSSTSGVVLPAFLPTVPGLVEQLGGGNPLAIALSINVGASMVDVSPLSTIGALCVATVTDAVAARRLFRLLLIWGLSMAVVAAVLCQALANVMAR